jgi:hypothetical protein
MNPGHLPPHYAYKRTVTVNAASGATLTNYPLLVSFSDPTLATLGNGGHVTSTKGYDIVVTGNSTCKSNTLAFEVDSYDPVNGIWIAHVNMPSLPSSTTTNFTLCYGNSAIVSSQANAGGVWNSNFTAVYHFSNLTQDSTSHAANATTSYVTQAAGFIGSGAQFAGGGGYFLNLPTAVQPVTAGSIDMWIYNTGGLSSTNWGLYSDNNADTNVFQLLTWYSGSYYTGWRSGSNDYRILSSASALPLGASWNHFAYTWDSMANKQTIYLNGSVVATSTSPFVPFANTGALTLGTDSSLGFIGKLDEVRFSNIALPAAWYATQYANQTAPGTFSILGAEQTN